MTARYRGLDEALVQAYAYLAAVGGEIMNLSSGVGIPTAHLTQGEADVITEDMLAAARRGVDDGILTVVSAGNDRHSEPDFISGMPYFYPELERGWLAVVASRSDDQLASYSQDCGVAANWCIAAPGGDRGAADGSFKEEYFLLPSASGGYYLAAGTSFSAPLVAGALAVTREIFPDAPIGDVRKLLLRTAVDAGAPGVDPVFGWGRLDLGNVVDTISPSGRSIFAGAAQTRLLSIEQVSGLPFRPRSRSSRIRAMWAAGNFARARSDAGSSGKTRSQSRALAAGLDLLDQQGLTAGIGLALARGTTRETGTANTARNDGLFGLGYAGWSSGRWYARGATGAGYLRQKHTRRSIPGLSGTVMEFENHQAGSRTNGLGIFTRLEAGRSFETELAQISLFGRFSASSQKLKGFQESDVDVLAYTVKRAGLTTATAGPGLRLSGSFASGGWTFTPEVEISYARVLGDRAPAVDAALLERPMEARTGDMGRDVLGLGANLSFSNARTGPYRQAWLQGGVPPQCKAGQRSVQPVSGLLRHRQGGCRRLPARLRAGDLAVSGRLDQHGICQCHDCFTLGVESCCVQRSDHPAGA
ncbi:autotransporter domain-containing protein [Nitratireductor sp. GISD-1A_MAKvit]|uniref:autotransporter domain-containing protein n=1 Tax=Nitratireductor sp. GISD-1A_MAKvit TaxID=3234198 RepID=UPI003467C60B